MDPTSAVLGAGVALVLWLLVIALRGEEGRSPFAVVLAAILPLAAVGATHLYQGESLVFPPKEFLDGALLAGAVAVPLSVAIGLGRGLLAHAGVVLVFALGAAALFYLRTESLHERYWDGEIVKWVAGLSGVAVLGYAGRLAAEGMGRTIEAALAMGLAAVAAAPALGWSGTGVTAMDAAALSSSAGLFGLLAVALAKLRPEGSRSLAPLGRAAATTQAALFAGFIGNGVLYSETPLQAGGMLVAAPLLVLLPGRGLVPTLVRLTLVAGVAAYAAYLSKGEPNPYGY